MCQCCMQERVGELEAEMREKLKLEVRVHSLIEVSVYSEL